MVKNDALDMGFKVLGWFRGSESGFMVVELYRSRRGFQVQGHRAWALKSFPKLQNLNPSPCRKLCQSLL